MHPIEDELTRMVELGPPGAFAYKSDMHGRSHFYTAGFADIASRRQIEPTDHYRVGSSTTKTFVAVVILQLIGEGSLTLEDTLQKWLPELSIPNAGRLTIEHLLRMRSGLFDYEDDESLRGNLEAHFRPYALTEAIRLGIKHPPAYLPDERFSYSNTNYCILEQIIERVTGNSLAVELGRRIIGPLDLSATKYPNEEDLTLPEPYIRGYEYKELASCVLDGRRI